MVRFIAIFSNLYLLAKKSDAFESYKDYEAWCSTQLDAHIKFYTLTEVANILERNLHYTFNPREQNKNLLSMTPLTQWSC